MRADCLANESQTDESITPQTNFCAGFGLAQGTDLLKLVGTCKMLLCMNCEVYGTVQCALHEASPLGAFIPPSGG